MVQGLEWSVGNEKWWGTIDTKAQHDLSVLCCYNFQGVRYLGSCRISMNSLEDRAKWTRRWNVTWKLVFDMGSRFKGLGLGTGFMAGAKSP